MKLRSEYRLMEQCVENATNFVLRRAFKHHPDPPIFTDEKEQLLREAIVEEVMNAISEWFTFDTTEEDPNN